MDTSNHRGNHLTRGRKFSAGELELMLLRLLGEQPQYGYEIIKTFATLSNDFYRPSPGVLYPSLNRLEQRDLARAQQDGKRKRYALTDAGQASLQTHHERIDGLFAILRHASRKMLWMRQAAVDEEAAVAATGWLPEFVAARRALKHALTSCSDASHAEQRRITAILRHTIAEIRSGAPNAGEHGDFVSPFSVQPSSRSHPMNTPDLSVQRVRHPIKARMLQVRRVTQLTPAMLRITLTGEDLDGFHSASFDDHIKVFVPSAPGERPMLPTIGPDGPSFPEGVERPPARDYTPRHFDAAKRELDIDFVLHHTGPATDWAANARPGDPLGIAGPRGSFIVPMGFDWHILLGDETAIPAIGRRLAELPEGKRVFVVIETRTPEARMEFQTACNASVQWVLQDADAENGMTALEAGARRITLPDGEGFVWAGAEYSVIRRLQQYYAADAGLHKDRIRASSYWRAE